MKIRIDELASNGGLEQELNNGVTYINNGGMHEENPNEGVLISSDDEGTPNLVEGKAKNKNNAEGKNTNTVGEVIYDDYVFSDRLFPTEEFRIKYKIPKDYTFAKAFRAKSKESEERPNDNISKNTLNDLYLAMRDNLELVRQNDKMEEAYNLFALLSPEELLYIALAADLEVMIPELYLLKYGGRIKLADGGELNTNEVSSDLSTSLLNTTIDLIMLYAKLNNDKDLYKLAKKAKKANREEKELFVDDALDTIKSWEEDNQYAFGGRLDNKTFMSQLAKLLLSMQDSELKKLLTAWLMLLSKLSLEDLDKAIELYVNAMLLQQLQLQEADYSDLTEEDLDTLYALGGNIYAEGDEIDKGLLPEVVVTAPRLTLGRKEYVLVLPKYILTAIPNEEELTPTLRFNNYLATLLAIDDLDKLDKILNLVNKIRLDREFDKGGSMDLNNPNSGNDVNGLKVFAGKVNPWKYLPIEGFPYYDIDKKEYEKGYLDFINNLDWETLNNFYNSNPKLFSRFLEKNPNYLLNESLLKEYKKWAHDGLYSDWHNIMALLYSDSLDKNNLQDSLELSVEPNNQGVEPSLDYISTIKHWSWNPTTGLYDELSNIYDSAEATRLGYTLRADAVIDSNGITNYYWEKTLGQVPYPKAPLAPFMAGLGLLAGALINNLRTPDYSGVKAFMNLANKVGNPRLVAPSMSGVFIRENPMDIDYMNNVARAGYTANADRIRNFANGNIGATMAGLNLNALNYGLTIGNNYRTGYEYNAKDRNSVAEFNRNTLNSDYDRLLNAARYNQEALANANELYADNVMKGITLNQFIDDARSAAINNTIKNMADMVYNIGATDWANRLAWAYSLNDNTAHAKINNGAKGGSIRRKRKPLTGSGTKYAPYNINTLKPKGLI